MSDALPPGYPFKVGAHARTSSWRRWALAWSPAVVIAAIWTILTLDGTGIVAAVLFCLLCSLIGVEVARDQGEQVSWVVVPLIAAWVPAMLGPLSDAPLLTLAAVVLMAATSPRFRHRWRPRESSVQRPVHQLSDWDLETQWSESEEELRSCAGMPEQKLAVVKRRAELLDELVRRREGNRAA